MVSLFGPNKRINQELYKKNAELAFQNKTLSLFRRLYTTTLATLEAKTLARNLVDAIRADFNFRIVGIYLLNEADQELTPLAVSFFNTEKEGAKDFFRKIAENRIPVGTSNVAFRNAFDSGSRQIATDIKDVWSKVPFIEKFAKEANIASTAIYPLRAENKLVGVFLASFNSNFNDLTTYETEALEGISNIVAIALDKATVYGELEVANKKLETNNLRLKELDQQKTDFLSIAAHQLRTPMSIMNGYIELIKENAYGKVTKETIGILDNMDASNQRLIKLVDEFLDVTRIEQGRTKFDFAECDLNKTIDSVVAEQTERAKEKHIKIVWKKPKTKMVASVDEEKVRHVIFNFIDNATKYSENDTITVKIRNVDDGIEVVVDDEGIGFNKTDENNFFQKFYRGENVKHIHVSGTGLGLFVCRRFIEAHKGKIWAHSEGLGKGSEFGFWVPVKSS